MRSVSPVWICEFQDCGHVWLASSHVAPEKCAKCKKRNWDGRGGDGSKAPMVEAGLLKAVAEGGRLDGAPPAPPGKGNSERFSAVVETPPVPTDPIIVSLPKGADVISKPYHDPERPSGGEEMILVGPLGLRAWIPASGVDDMSHLPENPVPVVIEDGVTRKAEEGEVHHGFVGGDKLEEPFTYYRVCEKPLGTEVVVPRQQVHEAVAKEHPKFGEKCPHNYANWMLCPMCNKGRA